MAAPPTTVAARIAAGPATVKEALTAVVAALAAAIAVLVAAVAVDQVRIRHVICCIFQHFFC